MAKKKRKKKRWLHSLLVYTGVPLAVWFVAFLLWFFWYDIAGLVKRQPITAPKAGRTRERIKPSPATPAEEKILNEDRKRLEDILNKRR